MPIQGSQSSPEWELLFGDLVQLAVPDTELDDLLADGFDLEIVEAPVIDADVLVPEGEAVKLCFGFVVAGGRLRVREVGMGVKDMQLLELLDPSQDTVKRSSQKYSQLHFTSNAIVTMRPTFQNSTKVSAGFPLVLKGKITRS